MELKIKKMVESEWQAYEIERFTMNEFLTCNLHGGYRNNTPQRGQLYNVKLEDEDADINVELLGLYTNYNFVADKDDEGNIVVYDNSFNFQIVG